jgi:hypothetical protein
MVNQTRDAGIDILKAVCIVLVVIWHSQPITAAMLPDYHTAAFVGKQAIKFFYWDISLLAVPSFILVSLYLFIGKLSKAEDYGKKRFLRLTQVYVFWVGIQFILYLLLGGNLPLPLKTIIRSGGPDLSFGAFMPPMPSIFYFLYILIFCTVLAFLFFKLPGKIKLTLATVVVVASCLYFIFTSANGIGIDTRSMKNYYIYIPLAYYLYHYRDKFIRYRVLFFIGFILSVFAEWTFNSMASAYGRMSILLGTLSLASVFVSGWSAANRPISLLSKYSMGIFALHPYGLAAVRASYALLNRQDRVLPPQSAPEGLLLFAAMFALTCLCVWLMCKTKLRMYVS